MSNKPQHAEVTLERVQHLAEDLDVVLCDTDAINEHDEAYRDATYDLTKALRKYHHLLDRRQREKPRS